MPHCYGSVAELKNYVTDSGSTSLGTTNDAQLLLTLEDASRSIDAFCGRTGKNHVVSGFGPRIGTNRYDGSGTSELDFEDDLISLTTMTTVPDIGGTTEALVSDTDGYLGPYDVAPYRTFGIHSETTSASSFYGVRRGVSVLGTWGYSNETYDSGRTTSEALDTTETGVDVTTATTGLSPGQTWLLDSEQVYVTSFGGSGNLTATVVRGANGTTAAAHDTGKAIYVYRYPRQVTATCLRLALRRWKQRDAGITGSYGGGEMPVSQPYDSEYSILRNGVQQFRLWRV